MKKTTTIISFVLLVLFGTACTNEKSLQTYLVESSEKEGYMYGDLPVQLLLSPKEGASEEVKTTAKSIQKINAAFFKKTAENGTAYETEMATLKTIFSHKKYKTLGSVKAKGMNMKLYYTGDATEIEEVIAFGYSDEVGVGVARILGKNMNPARIMEMLGKIDVNMDAIDLNQFKTIF